MHIGNTIRKDPRELIPDHPFNKLIETEKEVIRTELCQGHCDPDECNSPRTICIICGYYGCERCVEEVCGMSGVTYCRGCGYGDSTLYIDEVYDI